MLNFPDFELFVLNERTCNDRYCEVKQMNFGIMEKQKGSVVLNISAFGNIFQKRKIMDLKQKDSSIRAKKNIQIFHTTQ